MQASKLRMLPRPPNAQDNFSRKISLPGRRAGSLNFRDFFNFPTGSFQIKLPDHRPKDAVVESSPDRAEPEVPEAVCRCGNSTTKSIRPCENVMP